MSSGSNNWLAPILKSCESVITPAGTSKGRIAAGVFLFYALLVRLSRWRKYEAIHRKYVHKIDSLTPEEAQEIVLLSSSWDMPNLSGYALAFALFKTYANPSISSILAKSKELTAADTVSKRYLDTGIIVATWTACPITPTTRLESAKADSGSSPDPRAFIATARVNWLHAKYPITNNDYLYTLGLFIKEPINWTERFEWRRLSPLECQARFVLWRQIGTLMNINDIPESLEAYDSWLEEYERAHMVPAETNHKLAEGTLNELTYSVPKAFGLQAFVRRVVISLLSDRVRMSMMLPEQPRYIHHLVNYTLLSIAICQRYLLLPRWTPRLFFTRDDFEEPPNDGSLPRMRPDWFQAKPWYKPEPQGLFRLFQHLQVHLGLLKAEDLPGPKYMSQGYRLEETGPVRYAPMGCEEVIRMAAEMQGCPVEGPWARTSED
ncbi:uncharacterized protein STEHIDRAFT_62460 [Stereum hirsutum FP-91666 SS1]|uniref:uncharacterized protein n=1 Tax=Stereum hirsutum (strain FP-91666) TaxID=721885 RepID=UPI000444968F|nr:uncharacterized protein STEHIDRAFT_62460 [Stereum hirsutum FP-91666 SS1]EIM83948.1 hypothetical protein STEHIDRAFT_62460 [Stereum hirsutum FP-91666 SS1]